MGPDSTDTALQLAQQHIDLINEVHQVEIEVIVLMGLFILLGAGTAFLAAWSVNSVQQDNKALKYEWAKVVRLLSDTLKSLETVSHIHAHAKLQEDVKEQNVSTS